MLTIKDPPAKGEHPFLYINPFKTGVWNWQCSPEKIAGLLVKRQQIKGCVNSFKPVIRVPLLNVY